MTFVHFPTPVETSALKPGNFFAIIAGERQWTCLCVQFDDETAALVLKSSAASERPPFVVPMMNVRGWGQRILGDFTFRPSQSGIAFPRGDGWAMPGCLSLTPDGQAYLTPAERGGWGRGHYGVEAGVELKRFPEGSVHYPSWELLWEAAEGAARKPEIIASFSGADHSG